MECFSCGRDTHFSDKVYCRFCDAEWGRGFLMGLGAGVIVAFAIVWVFSLFL
jgi:hypothetical protein